YRMRSTAEDPGRPVTRMVPRALMIPPGVPDFLTRERHLAAGHVTLRGRAWSGHGAITAVDVSADGGRTWAAAALEDPVSPAAWCGWSCDWSAEPGTHELLC